ncbi:hypothetical protein M446_1360 [Methylobacterium sp. 4-46]|uniref:hypothetical protein n=1 Tax=unclassified Methylobacterium TaxID=2615210 RepID=UPI000165C62C|nr:MULTISPECIES: hypothetical protein [Methylobacterium]ACA15876.1 hypothetical protein M446_1360 [Methylobacterium sp. 4-46]WFT81602.1 hypothetical protein QA634_06895 [Methylobacterium nodulans]
MLDIIRIIAAAAVLVVWSHAAPTLAATDAAAPRTEPATDAPFAAEMTCPLRAWPYIG